jgi:thiol-disulfide isomerase/thioredoxin
MTNFLLTLSFLFLYSATGRTQGYRISVQYTPSPNSYLYLGYYFGDKKYLQDSAQIQADGTVIFSGNEPLTGGLYIVVDPEKKRFFDLLIDKEQTFSITIDTAFVLTSVTGSSENNYLESYKQATNRFFRNFQQWQSQLAAAKTRTDSTSIQNKINFAAQEAQHWRDSFTLAHPGSYLSLLFQLMKEPPYRIETARTRQDTLNVYYEYKKRYWENISFGDDRLLRTPMFEQRLTKYMDQVVFRHPDSLKAEIDKCILYSRNSKTMFRYYINRFTNEYMNPKYMGLDVVFLHLFEKYYLTNQVDWLEPKDKELVFNRAYSLMGNIVGEPAAELVLLDTADRKTSLYSIKAPYTLVVFWDPDCGHCREQVPVIDSLYQKEWRQMGMKLLGVLVDTIRSDKSKWPAVKANWTRYIRSTTSAAGHTCINLLICGKKNGRRICPVSAKRMMCIKPPQYICSTKTNGLWPKKSVPNRSMIF